MTLRMAIPRRDSVESQISAFTQLPVGWRYGEGVPCDPGAAKLAIRLNTSARMLGLQARDAFVGDEGSIHLTIYEGSDSLDFQVDRNLNITIVRETDNREVYRADGVSLQTAQNYIQEAANAKWGLSDLSISENGNRTNGGFAVQPSRLAGLVADIRYSVRNVLPKLIGQSVNTSYTMAT